MRLQILHLPASADEYPFALVVDDVDDYQVQHLVESRDSMATAVGARSTLVFRHQVEVL